MRAAVILAGSLGATIVAMTVLAGIAAGAAPLAPSPSSSAQVSVKIPDRPITSTPRPSPSPSAAPGTPGAPAVPSKPSKNAGVLKLDHERIRAGEWMVATGTDYQPGEQVQFVLYTKPIVIGSFVADESGTVAARFQIPKDTRPGTHTVEATGWDSKKVANGKFVVNTGGGDASGIPLFWLLIGIGGTLVAAGLGAVWYFWGSISAWLTPARLEVAP